MLGKRNKYLKKEPHFYMLKTTKRIAVSGNEIIVKLHCNWNTAVKLDLVQSVTVGNID